MYKATWKELRKIKKNRVLQRSANTKNCRNEGKCTNIQCNFWHEDDEARREKALKTQEAREAELTAQGQYFSVSNEVERGAGSKSDSEEKVGNAVIKQKQDEYDDPSHGFQADMTAEEIFNMFFEGGMPGSHQIER